MRGKLRARFGSILLTMAMLLSLLPVTAGASGEADVAMPSYTVGTAEENDYTTINSAVTAIAGSSSKNGVITLTSNITENVVIPTGVTVELNLGGNEITNDTNESSDDTYLGHTIVNAGMLTITGTGTVDNITHGKAALLNQYGGTVVLDGGTYTRSAEAGENPDNSGGNSWYTICNLGTMTINTGARVENQGHFSSMIENGYFGPSVWEEGRTASLTINGGTFSGGINTIKNDSFGTLHINGGDFSNTTQATVLNWHVATITGGTFTVTIPNQSCLLNGTEPWEADESGLGQLNISGGSFTSYTGTACVRNNFTDAVPTITGGTFSSSVSDYVADNYECVGPDSNGKYTVQELENKLVVEGSVGNDGNVSGSLTGEVGSSGAAVGDSTDNDITGDNTTAIPSKDVTISLTTGTEGAAGNATTTTLEVTKETAKSLDNANSLTVKTDAADVSFDKTALSTIASGADDATGDVTITVTNTTDTTSSPDSNVKASYEVSVTAGSTNLLPNSTNNGTVTITVPVPDNADTSKLTAWYVQNGVFVTKLGGSVSTDKTSFTFSITHLSEIYIVDGEITSNVVASYVDSNGLVHYDDSLADAIEAAPDGGTVTLLKNVVENVTIAADDNIILELNGCTLDGGTTSGKAALTNNGTVVIQDSSEAGTGTIKRSDDGTTGCYYTIRNEGTMTIKSGNICNNAGSATTWSGSSLICNGRDNSATLTIEGGNISQDYFIAVKNDEKGTLNITGGKISSKTQAVQNWKTGNITGGEMIGDVTTWAYSNVAGTTDISGEAYIDGDVGVFWYGESSKYPVQEGTTSKLTVEGGTITGSLIKGETNTGADTKPVEASRGEGNIAVTNGRFGNPVNELYLNESLKAELKSAVNTEAPYSYYTSMDDAIASAQPGDSVKAVNQDTSTTYYTLTLDYNDGGATADSKYTVASGTEITLPTPTRSGYDFLGWYAGSTKVSSSYKVTGNVTLVAQWSYIDQGSSSGSSEPSGDYIVSVDRVSGGKVTVNPGRADKGDEVTVTVKPNDGYELDELVVTDSKGNEIKLTAKSGTKFTFTMPSGTVDVKATFVKIDAGSVLDDFTDVNPDAWYAQAVEFVVEEGLMTGTSATTFAPDTSMSRAMIWTVLAAYNSYNTSGGNPWYAPGQQWAMVNGVSDGTAPNGSITREQLAVMLWRAAGSPETSESLSGYADASSVSDWAVEALAWAVDNGIISGMGGSTLAPQATATRAQVAVMLTRFVDYMEA